MFGCVIPDILKFKNQEKSLKVLTQQFFSIFKPLNVENHKSKHSKTYHFLKDLFDLYLIHLLKF